jgi:hypothetical protein
VSDLVEQYLLHLVVGACFAEVAGERNPSVTVDALAKPGLRVIPGE